jgi:hypothetical protein
VHNCGKGFPTYLKRSEPALRRAEGFGVGAMAQYPIVASLARGSHPHWQLVALNVLFWCFGTFGDPYFQQDEYGHQYAKQSDCDDCYQVPQSAWHGTALMKKWSSNRYQCAASYWVRANFCGSQKWPEATK